MSNAADLLQRYAEQGAEDAFAEFVRLHFNLVYSAALRQVWGNAHGAAEVAQNVFTDAARRARFLAAHPAIVGWLYTSTHFWAAKFRRTEQRRHRREQVAYAMNEDSTPVDWSEVRPHLDHAMQALSDRDREAVLMRFFEQMSFAAIAEKLGVQENAAQMRVSRALDKLRGILARRGVTSTAAALGTALAHEAVAAAPQGMCATVTTAALVKAGGSGLGAAAVAWHFMITSKTIVGTLGVLTAIVVGCGWYASVRAHHSAETADRAQRELGYVASAIRDRADLLASLTRAPVPAGSRPATPSAPARRPDTEAASDLARTIGRELTENPELRRSLGRRARAIYHLEHLELYRQLGLTAEQIDAVEKVRLKASSDELDLMEAAAELGHTTLANVDPQLSAPTSLAQAHQEVVAREYDTLRPILGDKALAEFQNYERLLPARSAVNQAMASLVFGDTPLTPTQRTELMHTIATHSPAYQLGESIDLARVDWSAVLHEASDHLAPAQIARLRTLTEQARSGATAALP